MTSTHSDASPDALSSHSGCLACEEIEEEANFWRMHWRQAKKELNSFKKYVYPNLVRKTSAVLLTLVTEFRLRVTLSHQGRERPQPPPLAAKPSSRRISRTKDGLCGRSCRRRRRRGSVARSPLCREVLLRTTSAHWLVRRGRMRRKCGARCWRREVCRECSVCSYTFGLLLHTVSSQ